MLIKAEVIRALAEAHPEWRFKIHPSYFYGNQVPEREFQYDFFQFGVDPVRGQYRSEDFFFVDHARALGFETYVLPQARTVHVGSHDYVLNMAALASLGKAPEHTENRNS
jgi:hypothetical protein